MVEETILEVNSFSSIDEKKISPKKLDDHDYDNTGDPHSTASFIHAQTIDNNIR